MVRALVDGQNLSGESSDCWNCEMAGLRAEWAVTEEDDGQGGRGRNLCHLQVGRSTPSRTVISCMGKHRGSRGECQSLSNHPAHPPFELVYLISSSAPVLPPHLTVLPVHYPLDHPSQDPTPPHPSPCTPRNPPTPTVSPGLPAGSERRPGTRPCHPPQTARPSTRGWSWRGRS